MKKENEKATIMLVDDTPANLMLLSEILNRQEYRVLTFPRGAMALEAACLNPPDLILMDIMMPEMNGFEVSRKFKEDPLLREIPILFISALDDIDDKVRAFSAGGVDYVIKPFKEAEVLARVETHLNLHRLQKELEKSNLYLEDLVRQKVKEISDLQLATIFALSCLAENRDDDTGHHINRTRIFCKLLSQKLFESPYFPGQLTRTFSENIYNAAPLHDIGKVGIPDTVLLKPGKLTPEEFEIMKNHVKIGVKTLEDIWRKHPNNEFINIGISLARSHHEKWDGSGYPEGLSGRSIPLSARIMALADVYDALRSKRTYKDSFSHEKSCGIIREGNGTHFDPALVEAFFSLESEFARISEQQNFNEWES